MFQTEWKHYLLYSKAHPPPLSGSHLSTFGQRWVINSCPTSYFLFQCCSAKENKPTMTHFFKCFSMLQPQHKTFFLQSCYFLFFYSCGYFHVSNIKMSADWSQFLSSSPSQQLTLTESFDIMRGGGRLYYVMTGTAATEWKSWIMLDVRTC